MRRILLALAGTVSGLVLLLAYPTSSPPRPQPAVVAAAPPTTTAGTGGATPSTGRSAAHPATTTVDGGVATTRWGPVQVRVTVTGGRIVDVVALQYPTGNPHDAQVNAYALPILRREVLAAQSARIDHVTGATVTSGGYVASLQSALDRVHA